MNIGIFTYGTRGDLQPYIFLAEKLREHGHKVMIAATEDFKNLVEEAGFEFHPLFGNAESMMHSPEGKKILQTENSLQLMKYYFKAIHSMRKPLRETYYTGIEKVDYVIANSMTLPIVSSIVEKQNKRLALTYFMPPLVETSEYPLPELAFFNNPWYNRLSFRIAQTVFWKLIKTDTNEYRKELGLVPLRINLIKHMDRQKILDLYCISPTLIPQPKDWTPQHKVTGFIRSSKEFNEKQTPATSNSSLQKFLSAGDKPIYIGFGSNGIGNKAKFTTVIKCILEQSNHRVLFCSGWSGMEDLPAHPNLYQTKYVNHDQILAYCKLAIFHGGSGTLATMIVHQIPMIIISFYTDQPTWGKIVESNKIGIHLPLKKLNAKLLLDAITQVQHEEIRQNLIQISKKVIAENGVEKAVVEIENYFRSEQT